MGNNILSIVQGQKQSNMQKYTRDNVSPNKSGENLSLEEMRLKNLQDTFHSFITVLSAYICQNKENADDKSYEQYIRYTSGIVLDNLGKYLELVNDELLNNPNFFNGECTINLIPSTTIGRVGVDENNKKHEKYIQLRPSYTAGTNAEEPNIFSVNIIERYVWGHTTQYGYIDFYSDGRVNMHDFVRKILELDPEHERNENGSLNFIEKTEPLDIKNTQINLNNINQISTDIMKMFEIAKLTTKKADKHI